MKILFWNMRGFGALWRKKQLKELRQKNRVAMICLQEIIKAEFSSGGLYSISEGEIFEWAWTAAQGHSGGTLVGVWMDNITMIGKDKAEFFTSMKISSRHDKIEWEVVNVYRPVHIERKADF
jgi:exonuclease III